MNKTIQMEYPKSTGSLYYDGKVHIIAPNLLVGLSINNKNIYLMDYTDLTSNVTMSTLLGEDNGIYNIPLTVYGQDFEEFKMIIMNEGVKIDLSQINLPDYIKSIGAVELREFLTNYYAPQNNTLSDVQDYKVDVYYRDDLKKFYSDAQCTREIFWNNLNSLFYFDPTFTVPVVGDLDLNSLNIKTRIIYNTLSSNMLLNN